MHVGLAGYDPAQIIRSMNRKGIELGWLFT